MQVRGVFQLGGISVGVDVMVQGRTSLGTRVCSGLT